MEKMIDKELLSQLLKLESQQQEMVLAYIKELLARDEINKRVEASERAIEKGEFKTFDQFNADFENWKTQRKPGMR